MLSRRAVLAAATLGGPLAAAGTGQARSGGLPLAARPLSRDLAWWRERHAAKLLEKQRRGRIDLVFLGDSITQQYEQAGPPAFLDYRPVWERFYGDRRALNLGFKGDATSHLLWRVENGEIADIAPRAVVVLIGANNFGHLHWAADDTILGIEAVVAATRTRLPSATIVVLSVLPSDRGRWVELNAERTNQALAERYAANRIAGVRYLDVTQVFLRDGRIDRTLYADPQRVPPEPALHPDAAAQARMAAALEPILTTLLGDFDHRA